MIKLIVSIVSVIGVILVIVCVVICVSGIICSLLMVMFLMRLDLVWILMFLFLVICKLVVEVFIVCEVLWIKLGINWFNVMLVCLKVCIGISSEMIIVIVIINGLISRLNYMCGVLLVGILIFIWMVGIEYFVIGINWCFIGV